MDTFIRDVRYSARMLLRNRGFAAVAVLSIAIGVGANTAVFSVINAVLLKSLPYKDPESLVLVWGDTESSSNLKGRNQVSATDVADIRKQATVFEDVATFAGWYPIMSGDGEAERIPAIQVGDGFFNVMRGTPLLGRVFTAEEQETGKDFVIVLSHGLWQRRFGSDPNIVGKTVALNTRNYTVVGVMRPDFRPLPETLVEPEGQFYRPVAEPYDESERSGRHLRAIARLKSGTTVEQAQAELNVIAQRLEREHPESNKGQGARVVTITDDTVGNMRRTLWLVLGVVVFVLLVACANVANLLLARSAARNKEITIRAAIGARRGQLVRQLLTESLLLSLSGGLLGLLLAAWGTSAIGAAASRINPIFSDIAIDGRVLLFTFAVSLVTGLVFGIAPALRISNPNLSESLKETGRSVGASSQNRLRSGLVISEIAITLVLLVCAGLLIRTVMRLGQVDTGFNSRNVLAMNIGVPSAKYPKPENIAAFYKQAGDRVAALPGVKAAGITSVLPLSDNFDGRGMAIEDYPKPRGEEFSVDLYVVSPGYLKALEIPLQQGRAINEHDTGESQLVAMINRTMAAQLWPNQDPIGKRIRMPVSDQEKDRWRVIVGVVSDVTQYALDKKPPMQVYFPHSQFPTSFNTLVVKTDGDASSMIAAVRSEIKAIDKDQAVFKVTTLEQLHSQSMGLRRFLMFLLVVFASLALLLAAVGIYGVMSYAVSQRTREFGIRMALGARAPDVMKLVAKNGITLALIGVGIGLVVALALTRLMTTILFGVTSTDATTFAIGAAGLIAVAAFACYVPARRATKVDPLVALRYE